MERVNDFTAIIEQVLEVERQEAERKGDEMDSIPRPGASPDAIAKAEAARGRTFVDAYRAFLATCDGWDHFAWGISLFGTEELSGEEYDDAVETLGYTDDVPAELEAALIIGKNENDATVILLLDTGEVVDHLYEETERFPDLGAYLLDRKQTLLEMREDARQAAVRTEREWDPAVRAADDAAITDELRSVVRVAARPPAAIAAAGAFADPAATPTPAPKDLVALDGDGELAAALDLGIVLYLGACPTRDETLATFRAFRRAFPFPGPIKWVLADYMSFGMKRSDDPDAEPFADALRVDDQGFYGLRASGGDEPRAYILNVRGMPPDDDGTRRASFVEVLAPADEDPRKLRELCHALADILPVRSGHGGYFARARDKRHGQADPWDAIFGWCRRYFQIEPCYVDGWLGGAVTRHRGAGWLTVLGRPFVDALAPLALSASISRRDAKHGVVLEAGELTLGDVARGDFPVAVAEVARLLEPVALTSWAKRGNISMGGVWFSTFATQLPGAFNHHHATESYMRRFVDPERFLGPSAREVGMALIQRLRATMDEAKLAAWTERFILDEIEYFKDLLQALYLGAYHTPDAELAIEALRHVTRFPDWAPAAAYNNLLLAYLRAGRIDDGVALMPVALRTAKEGNNPHTYHNAACVLVAAGRFDEAMECVRLARDEGYPHMDKIESDDDLTPLRARDDWKALFAGA